MMHQTRLSPVRQPLFCLKTGLETTAIYAHVSKKDFQKIISPLDRIFDNNKLITNKLKP